MIDMCKVHEILMKSFSVRRLIKYVSELSAYHRIQGSEDLEKAGDYIFRSLKELEANVKTYIFSYEKEYGLNPPLIGWWVKDAELLLKKPKEKLLHNFNEGSTLVIAHSPGGYFEGEVVSLGNGDDPESYEKVDIKGKVVLAYGLPYITYMEVVKRGAKALLLYRKSGGPDDAIPYFGLFPLPTDVDKLSIPALSISRKTANELLKYLEKKEKVIVSGYVNAGYRSHADIKVIEASFGEGDEEIHLISHYCHPGGTVNDNVSGAATLMELVNAFNYAKEKGWLSEPKERSIKFIWVPEYMGTLPYLLNKEKSKIIGAINLDMIGENQEITGSVLMLIRPLIKYFTYVEPILYKELRNSLPSTETFSSPSKVLAIKFDTTSYVVGSDHDIYLNLGIGAVMINQWPDRFYHTNKDTIDKFDPNIALRIGAAVGSAAYLLALKWEKTKEGKKYVKNYLISVISNELLKVCHDDELYELRQWYICFKLLNDKQVKDLNLNSLKNFICKEIISKSYSGEKFIIKKPGLITSSFLYRKLGLKRFSKLRKTLSENHWGTFTFQALLPTLLREPKTLDELYDELVAECGIKIKKEVYKKVISTLVNLGIIEKYT